MLLMAFTVLVLTVGCSVTMTAWINVLLGDVEAVTVENHSLRSRYSACNKENLQLNNLVRIWFILNKVNDFVRE